MANYSKADRPQGKYFEISSLKFIIFTALFFESILNLSLWRFALKQVEVNSPGTFFFALSLPVFIFIGLFLIFTLLVWPHVYKALLLGLIIVSCAANYVMFQYGIFIDTEMVRNLFETNQREALDFVNAGSLLWLAFSGILPLILLIKTKVTFQPVFKEIRNRIIGLVICLLLLGAIGAGLYKEYVIFGRNNRQITRLINPTNYIYATWRYFQRKSQANREFVKIDENARHAPFPDDNFTVLVLVIGETARTMNFSLNGYERQTNPQLALQDVISFQDVTASGTATAFSLPAMFSHLPRSKFDLDDAPYTENLLDLLAKAGYEVIWLENDDGCKKVCDRVFSRDMARENNTRYCDGDYCFDEVLIEPLGNILGGIQKDSVIVLHTMGSHGPSYYKRYPDEFRKFEPTCDTSEVQNCSTEDIVNTYDNTILYTDHVLNQAIDALKKHPELEAGLLYVSDHGESLGENGVYLHGLPFSIAPDEQTKVPLILWMSEVMKRNDHLDYGCLKQKSSAAYSHDYLFHSLLALLELDTKMYQSDLDLFVPCRLEPWPQAAGRGLNDQE